MNPFQQKTSKAIALFLSLGLIAPLAGCEAPVEESDEQPTEQTAPSEGGEGGEGGEDG